MPYLAPELAFKNVPSKASDVWALACAVFEMRSGFQFFLGLLGSYRVVSNDMLKDSDLPREPLLQHLTEVDFIGDRHAIFDTRALEVYLLIHLLIRS